MEAIIAADLPVLTRSGLYALFPITPGCKINTATDLNKFDNYQFYLGTGKPLLPVASTLPQNIKVSRQCEQTYATGSQVLEYIQPRFLSKYRLWNSKWINTGIREWPIYKTAECTEIAGDRWTLTILTVPIRVYGTFQKDSYNWLL